MPPTTTIWSERERADHRHQTRLLADRTWLALAALAEADPDNIVTTQLLATAPSVQRLSLRNQITLLVQTGAQRIPLRDVDTTLGWARRGRVPSGPGLWVVHPHDKPGKDGDSLFRASDRWEFTQTEPAGGTAPQTEPDTAGDPAEFAEHLIDQLRTRGYRVTRGAATVVDHQAQLVTVEEPAWRNDPVAAVRVLIPELAHALVTGAGIALDVLGGGLRAD